MFEYICLFDRQHNPFMPDQIDAKTNLNQGVISLDELCQKYTALASGLSKRASRVLDSWRASFQDDRSFFDAFISADRRAISSLPGCNLFARVEILNFRKNLLNGAVLAPESEPDEIEPIPQEEIIPEEVEVITEPIEGDYTEVFEEEPLMPESSEELFESLDEPQSSKPAFPFVTPEQIEPLTQIQESLGHFPLFALIKAIIENNGEITQAIIAEGTRFYEGVENIDIDSLKERLNLTDGSIRGKRRAIINMLEAMLKLIHDVGYIDENPYKFQMNHIEHEINASEGTNFSLPFVYWVLGTTFPELTYFGDAVKYFTAQNNSRHALFLAPTELIDIFDFQGFIDTINEQLKVRRTNEESISLSDLMADYFKVRYYEEELPEVERTCRTFLYINFPVEVDYGNVIFPSNKKKTNIQIVEEILRSAQHPMMLSEILDEFLYEYPERDVNEDRIRGAIYLSGKIIPTLPPGSYAWDDGTHEEFKGGSVINYIEAYLQSLPEKIATSADVAEYVTGFIPDTNEEKIMNRLFSDLAKDLVTYYREGVRYIGYVDGNYPDDFFSYPSDYRIALTYSTMFPAFIKFVEEHHRYPFTRCEDSEEMKIRLFWIRVEHMYETGELDARTAKYFERISGPLSRYKMDKPEYFWRVQFAHLAHEIGLELDEEEAFFLNDGPFESTVDWTKRNLTDYKYRIDKMQDWKKERIERIIRQLQSFDNPYTELINKLKLNVQDNLG
ncbi:MAG: hypothetical protein K5651_01070 [Bacteroidales bacterium]|nr:hypothetical protein [Bacteroidales bacterium]